MKKRIAISLAVLLLLSTAACTATSGSATPASENPTPSFEIPDKPPETSLQTPETTQEPADPEPATPETTSEATEPETETPEPAEETQLQRGTVDGQTYQNDSFGFGWTLPAGWTYYDDGQLGQGNGEKTTSFDELFRKYNTACDMFAMDLSGTANVSVSVQKLGDAALTMDEEDFADLSVDSMEAAMQSYGMTLLICEKQELSFLGQTHWGLTETIEYGGTQIVELFVFLKHGDCFVMVSATAADRQTAETLLERFYTIP